MALTFQPRLFRFCLNVCLINSFCFVFSKKPTCFRHCVWAKSELYHSFDQGTAKSLLKQSLFCSSPQERKHFVSSLSQSIDFKFSITFKKSRKFFQASSVLPYQTDKNDVILLSANDVIADAMEFCESITSRQFEKTRRSRNVLILLEYQERNLITLINTLPSRIDFDSCS